MQVSKKARSGLLLFLTIGPFLVFVFLYVFGKNKYEVDTYPLSISKFSTEGRMMKSPLVLLSNPELPGEKKDFQNEAKRLDLFFKNFKLKPDFFSLDSQSALPVSSLKINATFPSKLLPAFWFESDTVLEIKTAKGSSAKRLPKPPRAFLFDTLQNLRGVYGLCNSESMDTLMLEYKILTEQ